MDNQIQQAKPSDEIDLIELFNRIGNGIKKAFNWVLDLVISFFLLLLRKSLWIISFMFIGIFVGYFFYSSSPRYYSSEMVASSNSMNNGVIVNSINLLEELFKNKNYNAIASYLFISSKDAEKIKSIDAYYGIDINRDGLTDYVDYDRKYNPIDTSKRRVSNIFYLKISVYDETVFSNIRDGIKKYINTNQYVLQNNDVRKQQINSMVEEYKNEIEKLENLQKVQYTELPKMQKSSGGQMIVLNEKEVKLYHNDIIALYNKKLELEKELAINPDPITVIQDFTQLSKVDNPLIKFLKIWVIVFMVLGFCISILWQYKSNIWHLIKDKQY